jgi:hypothetical protein
MNFRDLIVHNFRLKLFSLLIALLIWETINLATKRYPGSSKSSPAASPKSDPS